MTVYTKLMNFRGLLLASWIMHSIATIVFVSDQIVRRNASEYYEGSPLSALLLISLASISVLFGLTLFAKSRKTALITLAPLVISNIVFVVRTQELKSGVLVSDPNMVEVFENYSRFLSILQVMLVVGTVLALSAVTCHFRFREKFEHGTAKTSSK